jgi:hypothetical protein
MANEISFSYQLLITNGSYSSSNVANNSYTQNAIGASGGVQTVTTSLTHLDLGSVTTLGYTLLKNLDPTNYVDVGIDSAGFVGMARLKAGEVGIFRWLPGVTPSLKANTATCSVSYLLLQD